MITTKAKLSLTVITLLALTTPLLLQRQTVGELRRQNRLLTDELRAAQVSRQAAVMEATARPSSAVILPLPPNAVKPVWQQVESGNFQEYMANLRGLGMPEQTVRDIVLADVNRLYDEKKRAVLDSIERKDEFWKPGGTSRTAGPSEMDQLRTLAKEKEGLLRDLFGLETDQRDYAKPFNPRDVDDELDWKWTFLTPEKRSLIRDLTIAFRRELPDAPWDEEKHGGLQKQYDENVNQALNPAELEEHQVRHSALTARLQTELQSFQPTEGEFRSIFRLLNDFGRNTPGHLVPPEAYEEDRQTFANPKLRERLQEVLGADRFSQFERTLNTTVPEQ